MSEIRIKYIGTDPLFSELGITGQPQTWSTGHSSFVTASNAALLVATGKFVYVDKTPAFLATDPSGNITGLVGPDGKPISLSGRVDQTSENSPAARSVKTTVAVTQVFAITANSSSTSGHRVAHAEKNRKRVVFKNPATNTASFQLGLTQNDNINRNGSYTTSQTIAPGEELSCWYDQNQWFARQTDATGIANQYLIVESEVNV